MGMVACPTMQHVRREVEELLDRWRYGANNYRVISNGEYHGPKKDYENTTSSNTIMVSHRSKQFT